MTTQSERAARDAADATRLLFVHATSNRRAAGNQDYVRLVTRLIDEPAFLVMVKTMADGMDARIVSFDQTDGVVLSVAPSSPMASEWRKLHAKLEAKSDQSDLIERRAVAVAVMLAVAATFFPTAQALSDESSHARSITVADCIETVRAMVAAYKTDKGIEADWGDHWSILARALESMPDRSPKQDRSLKTLERSIERVLEMLRDAYLVAERKSSGAATIYTSGRRYRLQVMGAANRTAIELAQALRASGAAAAV